MLDLSDWKPRPRPEKAVIEGRLVRLEPLDPDRHGDGLFEASTGPGTDERFRYLPEEPPVSRANFQPWLEKAASSDDPLFFAVVSLATGKVLGRQTLMRIDAANGVVEIGNIYWGPAMARTAAATESLQLFACHVFDQLGYRRFEWKCNALNEPSRRAALRFGFSFEGLFRQHMIVKGQNRDTAWYAMLDTEWPNVKRAFEAWLDPSNFGPDGRQRRRLEEIREERVGIQA